MASPRAIWWGQYAMMDFVSWSLDTAADENEIIATALHDGAVPMGPEGYSVHYISGNGFGTYHMDNEDTFWGSA